MRTGNFANAIQEVLSQLRRFLNEVFIDQHAERFAGNGAGEWISSERAAMIARFINPEDLPGRNNSGNGINSTTKRFSDNHQIRAHSFMVQCEECACASETGLNFI